ncbi:ABC transporter ATP-binding protein [Miniphocaeibacter massiliensis]|uniref:ABC transporter ATP-binding protein n=1 Tax=Miniphocaeibacter massiliensis TaxID=2041841 RepID=UPI000C1BA8DE|nr:ABC transporter ATP-binding protein [Miniphocaeibacter massiliensis]
MLKNILKSVREYKVASFKAPAFVAIEVIFEVLMPFLMAWLIDKGIRKNDMDYITKLGLILVLASIFSLIAGTLAGRAAADASAGFAKNLRFDIFKKIQSFSFKNLDDFSTAGLVTRLTTDITNIQAAYQLIIRTAVRSPLMLVFSLIMAMRINSEVAMIFFIMIPLLAVALLVIIFKVHPIFEKVFNEYDNLNRVVQENVSGIRVVKSFAREEEENKKFDKMSMLIFKLFKKAEKIIILNGPVVQFSVFTAIIFISFVGAKQIVSENMLTGQLMSLITYAWQILNSLVMFSFVLVNIIISRTSMERISEVLNTKPDLRNIEKPVEELENGEIIFDKVYFSYIKDKEKSALKDINLNIKSGETVGIIGGTGSGKSSLVQLIPRLYDVTDGSIKIAGKDVRDYDLKILRDSVAMVLQKNILFSGTIKENLRWGNKDATDDEIIHACKLAQAHEFIMSLPDKYDTVLDQGGTNLSGGQRQRVCIARALLKSPKILILDDSTSAVDTKTDAAIRRAFKEEIPNVTKIIIAQRINSIEDSDKIIIIDKGQIVAVGSPEELMKTSKIYQEVYNSQMKGGLFDEQ